MSPLEMLILKSMGLDTGMATTPGADQADDATTAWANSPAADRP